MGISGEILFFIKGSGFCVTLKTTSEITIYDIFSLLFAGSARKNKNFQPLKRAVGGIKYY
jgi:hypothetical protein